MGLCGVGAQPEYAASCAGAGGGEVRVPGGEEGLLAALFELSICLGVFFLLRNSGGETPHFEISGGRLRL